MGRSTKFLAAVVLGFCAASPLKAEGVELTVLSYLDGANADVLSDLSSIKPARDASGISTNPNAVPLNRNVNAAYTLQPDTSRIARLRSLIASAEAGSREYDAVQHGARILPPHNPTEMTVAEILDWVRATPNQPHAIGRYQFIPSTLRSLIERGDISPNLQFTPDLQDRLANILLMDAGLIKFQQGRISQTSFMNNLARIWAGLPTSSGKSAYHGFAGNHATISWAEYSQKMASIFQ